MEEVKEHIEVLLKMVLTLEHDDIPAMGNLLNHLTVIESIAGNITDATFSKVIFGIKQYIEKLVLSETQDLSPLIDAAKALRSVWSSIQNHEPFGFSVDELFQSLDIDSASPTHEKRDEQQNDKTINTINTKDQQILSKTNGRLSEDDKLLLSDFLGEARESLESIECELVNLEQSPDDKDIINSIFRPFHTIKGVSGFLGLKKVNTVSHHAENLLDQIREGRLKIQRQIIDVILASVDMIRQLLQRVEEGLPQGLPAKEDDIDIENLLIQISDIASAVVFKEEKLPDIKDVSEQKPPLIPEDDSQTSKIGEILIAEGRISDHELEDALDYQKHYPDKRLGQILLERERVETDDIQYALNEQKKTRSVMVKQVKVDTQKLDNLVDYTGELVIAHAMLKQSSTDLRQSHPKLFHSMNQVGQIVSNIQKIAMSMRMVPVKNTFQKMIRLVRDLARNIHKQVHLEMSGEDTEIDRNVVEMLYEPMVHMIRNAVDHGLEFPKNRVESGKSPYGTIFLNAYHKAGNIVIEIKDDGKGLNKEKILQKAIKLHLIDPNTECSEQKIFELIMAPGFSTADSVTNISGRGVGMDVVKKAIEELHGRLDIQSVSGQGTTFMITLPLTLAIIDGMIIRSGSERYIIPSHSIVEFFQPTPDRCYTVEGKGNMMLTRGQLLPLARLQEIFKIPYSEKPVWEHIALVVSHKQTYKAFLVDELIGKQEIVVKNLGDSFKEIKGIAGCAILGDGRIGLILDVEGIFTLIEN
ncbi:MAG: chemotaxis protein CheA [Desulfobacterales bacterium]|nr:chemotaxis protein CheA [Desulfobacterales bacterium]